MSKQYDVVIIGAGLAGLQCARLLGKQDLRVLLVDCKANLEQSVHTTGIFVRRTLEDFDLPHDCLGPPISHVTLYSPSRRAMELTSPHAEFRVGKMAKLYQRYLDHCLRAGVEWMPDTRYAELQLFPDHLMVRLQSGSSSRWIRTRFLVGADGANSRVARDLRLDLNREWIVGLEDVFVGAPLDGAPRLHCFLDPKVAPGYLAWVANDGHEVHVGVGGHSPRFEPLAALEHFRESVVQIVDLKKSRPVERRGGRIPVGGVLSRIVTRHGLLVGDAAGAVSPLTAGGLDPCMRLSTLAARVIGEFLKTKDERVLSVYSGELFRARFVSRIWMRRAMSMIRGPVALELACAGLRLPIMNRIARHVFFGRGSFPDPEEYPSGESFIEVCR